MKQLNIAFDLDGTLVDFMAVVKSVGRGVAGIEITDTKSFCVNTAPHISDGELWEIFKMAYGCTNAIQPYEGAAELMEKLWDLSHDPITIITARPREAANDTYKLVDKFVKVPYRLILTEGYQQKLQYLNGLKYYVDDRRKTALIVASTGKTVYVPRHCYNEIENAGEKGIIFIDGVKDLIPMAHLFVEDVPLINPCIASAYFIDPSRCIPERFDEMRAFCSEQIDI